MEVTEPGPLKLSEGPESLEAIANHEAVFPTIARKGWTRVDITSTWDECIGIEFETGGWLMHWQPDHRWEAHTLVLPNSQNVDERTLEMLQYMFTGSDAEEIIAKVPADQPELRELLEGAGFTWRFSREGGIERESGFVRVDYYTVTLDEWIVGSGEMIRYGNHFMTMAGIAAASDHDATQLAYAGFIYACVPMKQKDKALRIYNRWAMFAGYPVLDPVTATVAEEGNETDNEAATEGDPTIKRTLH